MEKACLFDINGTLLDLSSLDGFFVEAFGSAIYRQLWYETVLRTSMALSLADDYRPFSDIGEETLVSMSDAYGRNLDEASRESFETRLSELKAFTDVRAGLDLLKRAGYRLAALTNSAAPQAEALLEQNGLRSHFCEVLSTDAVKRNKPAPQPYLHTAEKLGIAPGKLWLVAAHAWDTMGAASAGLRAALVERRTHGLNGCFPRPDAAGADLGQVAHAIVCADRSLAEKVLHRLRE